jgi:hypothetical protein
MMGTLKIAVKMTLKALAREAPSKIRAPHPDSKDYGNNFFCQNLLKSLGIIRLVPKVIYYEKVKPGL